MNNTTPLKRVVCPYCRPADKTCPFCSGSKMVTMQYVSEPNRIQQLQEALERVEGERDEAKAGDQLPRTDNLPYDLRQRLNRAMRWLRDAEDIARIEMPDWPTADRIRSIHELLTDDVLNGNANRPSIGEQLAEAERRLQELREAVQNHIDHRPPSGNCLSEPLRLLLDHLDQRGAE